jgi:hypothetical protein
MSTKAQIKIGENDKDKDIMTCGVIMPISAIDGLSAEHWVEVFSILQDVIKDAGFEPSLVSNADEAGIIHKRNVHSIYTNPIIVFDVSAKNPKVMFELGLRLALDKPTIIIKDDVTDYNFDASPIKPITYPRDLRFTPIVAFKKELRSKIETTYRTYEENPEAVTFFKELGEDKSEKVSSKEITADKIILDSLEKLTEEVKTIKNNIRKEASGGRGGAQANIAVNNFTDIFLRPENLEIFVTSKIDQFVKVSGLKNRTEIEKQLLQHKVFEFIASSNPELENDVIERLILEVINRQIKPSN